MGATVSRKNETCVKCCGPATCHITGSPFFDTVDGRYKWRFEVIYEGATHATLTGYDGSAFTYPGFNGQVVVDAGLCDYTRFVLTVTATNGQVRECIFTNPNCCCQPYRVPDANEFRVPMSRGVNRLQPSMLVTISGVRTFGNVLNGCGWPAFYNRSFLVPFHTALTLSDTRFCAVNPPLQPDIVQTIGSLRIVWGHRNFPAVGVAQCVSNIPCGLGDIDGVRATTSCYAYGVRISGSLVTTGSPTSSFELYEEQVFYGAQDYEQICNPYRVECEALSNVGNCNFYPEATSFPVDVRCADQRNSLGCFGLPPTTCARDCGLIIFRDIVATFQLVPN